MIRRYFWHHVQQLGAGQQNVSLNFWVGGKGNDEFNRAAARAAARSGGGEGTPAEEAVEEEEAEQQQPAACGEAEFEAWLRSDASAALRAFKAGRLAETIAARAPPRPWPAPASFPSPQPNARPPALASTIRARPQARACGGDAARGGELLTDLAAGEDAAWPAASKPRRVARRLRRTLAALLDDGAGGAGGAGGARRAAALLRALTRNGRLHPGLAPAVEGPVVASESGEWGGAEQTGWTAA